MSRPADFLGCLLAVIAAAPGCGDSGLSTAASDLAGSAPADASADAATVPDAAVSTDQACADLAQALCAAVKKCEGVLFEIAYSDLATCAARNQLACKQGFDAKGSQRTADSLAACAKVLPNVSCTDLYSSKLPAECAPVPGTIADGSACGDDAQCKSTYCAKPNGSSCGVCGPVPTVGTSCANTPCARGLTCGAVAKTCVAWAALGSTCDPDHPCLPSLSCVGATMGKVGMCKTPIGLGAACVPNDKECDGLQGLYCDGQTKSCAKVGLAAVGDACGILLDKTDAGVHGRFTICSAAGHCRAPDGGISGNCIAPAADGAPCDDGNGPGCTAPAHCVAGLCKIDNPAACM